MPEAHKIMKQSPMIGQTIDDAIQRVENPEGSASSMAPLNHELYYQSQEGQGYDSDRGNSPSDAPMGLFKNSKMRNHKDSSSSCSESDSGSDRASPEEAAPIPVGQILTLATTLSGAHHMIWMLKM